MTMGDLRLIRDERLRVQLVAYATRMEGERENLRLYWQQGFSDLGCDEPSFTPPRDAEPNTERAPNA